MRSRYLAVCAALFALAACDGESASPVLPVAEPSHAVSALAAPTWTIFTTQQPTEFLDAGPDGWEVSTTFRTSKPGRVVGFRFYRAPGETGTNQGKLWSSSGQRLKRADPFPEGTGWVERRLGTPVRLTPGAEYRVSVNTNTRQAKKPGGFYTDGAINNGPLTATGSDYGQPIGAMPTRGSPSMYFIDVIFEEDVPPPPAPNLRIGSIQSLLFINGQEHVRVRVCNVGDAPAGGSWMRLQWYIAPLPSGQGWVSRDMAYSHRELAANGDCENIDIPTNTYATRPACHQFHAYADHFNHVPESNEGDNALTLSTCHWS